MGYKNVRGMYGRGSTGQSRRAMRENIQSVSTVLASPLRNRELDETFFLLKMEVKKPAYRMTKEPPCMISAASETSLEDFRASMPK